MKRFAPLAALPAVVLANAASAHGAEVVHVHAWEVNGMIAIGLSAALTAVVVLSYRLTAAKA